MLHCEEALDAPEDAGTEGAPDDRASPAQDVAGILRRLGSPRETVALVVDDSPTSRVYLTRQLERYGFQVLQAADGVDALAVMESRDDVSLIVSDYSMPRMDGFELVRRVRQRWPRDQVAIIGLSATGDASLTTRFLRSGANDFLVKPFVEEEFRCRVMQNVEMLDCIRALREAAVRDFLTGLHNRRYLFDAGERLHASARRGQIALLAAMIDIDHFKQVNDTWGHDAGDEVIRRVAALLRTRFRGTDIVARFGGEEFCVLAVNFDADAARWAFDGLREAIAAEPIAFGGRRLPVTASIGVCCAGQSSLEALVSRSDELLYAAKSAGRNRVALAA